MNPAHPFGIIDQTYNALSACDESMQAELAESIVLAGGTSLLPGLGDRLQDDLMRKMRSKDSKAWLEIPNVRVLPSSHFR